MEMDDGTRKEMLVEYQKGKQEEVMRPFLKQRVAFGIVPHVQAMLLARYLRGIWTGIRASFGGDAMPWSWWRTM